MSKPTRDSLVRLEQCAAELPNAIDRGKRRRVADAAAKSAASLDPVVVSLEAWVLTAKDWPNDLRPGDDPFSAKLQALSQMGRELQQVTSTLALERVSLRWNQIQSTASDLLKDGERYWFSVLGQLQWCESLGRALQQVPRASTVGRQFSEIYQKVSKLRVFPPGRSHCEQLSKLRAEAEKQKEGLKNLGIGAAVETFLKALANDNASLELVSDEVLTWLKKSGMSKQLRVLLRPAQS